MSLQVFLFYVVAGLTGLSAISVVVTQNIVRSAAFLLFALGGTAGIFFLLGADFVGATQLIVYVGGILVLVVFGVMLTAQGPFISMKTGAAEWAVAVLVGLLLYAAIAVSILTRPLDFPDPRSTAEKNKDAETEKKQAANVDASRTTTRLGEAFLGFDAATKDAKITGVPMAKGETEEAWKKRTPERKKISYLLPFEIVSVHLLVVLIGAAYLARAKRRRGAKS